LAESELDVLRRLNLHFQEYIELNKAMAIECVSLDRGQAQMRMPYSEALVGNPQTGVLHGGAITTLLDSACGSAAFMSLDEPTTISTLDLRIDYLRPATPGRAVIAAAHCYRRTRSVAFLRCSAWHDEGDPIATGQATFMISTPRGLHAKGTE